MKIFLEAYKLLVYYGKIFKTRHVKRQAHQMKEAKNNPLGVWLFSVLDKV